MQYQQLNTSWLFTNVYQLKRNSTFRKIIIWFILSYPQSWCDLLHTSKLLSVSAESQK
uniref:Uncharacterized protein n=1 Tax=Anguilla anguilla TaxID=7936 RepID=A0A0E9X002_ANGAN